MDFGIPVEYRNEYGDFGGVYPQPNLTKVGYNSLGSLHPTWMSQEASKWLANGL